MPADPRHPSLVLAGRLAAIEEGPMRAHAAAAALAALPPREAAQILDAWVRRAGDGDPRALAAAGQALLAARAPLDYEAVAAIYEAAAESGFAEVQALLVAPPAREASFDPPPDPALAAMTLGHKKAWARGHRDPDLLARLAAEGAPDVVRELLRNPRLTEELVVRIAARRPCRPATLREILGAARWRVRPRVLAAVAKNPHAEPALALKLLPALAARDLEQVAGDAGIAPLVRGLARRLLVRRSAREPGT